ncbi:class E sortase [Streptomyces diacarni]|uniref:class E sortase n=1 Tax=Streptomyces diacarni TaxID=2800381 RepID=UPI00248271D0|nr:class E sortase [Streptomyces diacarni]
MTTGHGEGARGAGSAEGTQDAGGGHGASYDPYRAAIDALADPLNDPLPAPRPPAEGHAPEPAPEPVAEQPAPEPVAGAEGGPYGAERGRDEASWWFAPEPGEPGADPYLGGGQPPLRPQPPSQPGPPSRQPRPAPPQPDAYGPAGHGGPPAPPPGTYAHAPHGGALHGAPAPDAASAPPSAPAAPVAPADRERSVPRRSGVPGERRVEAREEGPSTLGLRAPRREAGGPSRTERPPGPSRLEARRAARALKPGPGIIASRAIGEAFITCGVLMMLFVVYQVWWSNIRANQQAGGATDKLHEQWDRHQPGKGVDPERKPGAFEPGEGFAVIHIPRIDVTAPIAQGVSKTKVLDKGMVGHYATEPLKTAMPWDRKGNFALAGHRNTHGEPFRYINRLEPGDVVVVETQSKYYTYKVTRQLPSTSPSDTGVIDPVPPKSGFAEPGRYVTLTTCTPEFTSKYRLIVWGKMVDERPRSKGKPDALVD